ncbi:MAG: hypothetical protein LBU53_04180 [Zoogloeaceae bacterium]|nr:hypothetical protein [Zoogloeaceae bacterium]
MKKFAWVMLTLLVALVAMSVYFLRDEPLTPLAEQALNYRPVPVPAEQNAFVGLVGLTAPAGSDFVQVGEEMIWRENLRQKPEQAVEKLAFSVKDYRYTCIREITENCLNEIWADAENIQKLLLENDTLIQRYLKIQKMPIFSNYSMDVLSDSHFSLSGEASQISRLLSAKAILDIKNGDIAQGLRWMEKDMAFYRKILAAKDVVIFDKVVAIAHIQRYAIFLSLLVENGKLRGQDEIVRALLLPLDSHRENLKKSTWREVVGFAQDMSHMMLNTRPDKLFEEYDFDERAHVEQNYSDKLIAYLKYYLMYKHNMTVNLQVELWRHEMEIIDTTPLSRLSDENVEQKALERAGCTNAERIFCKHMKNYIGEVLVLIRGTNHSVSLLRIYDADAFLRLARAQLEYQLAAKQPDADPAKILASLPPETFNPYTGKPFDFDAERGVIGFQPAANRDKDRRVEIHLSLQ